MTIKKQIFITNVRAVLVTLVGFLLLPLAGRIILTSISESSGFTVRELFELFRTHSDGWSVGLLSFMSFTVFVIIISSINTLLTSRLIKRIVQPLKPLAEGVRQIRNLNFSYRINYQNEDEYRPICDAFNDMAVKLEASADEQRKNEKNRRELIAGISHDLRTPLTLIKGCIEGLDTGIASTPEMRDKYFSIIKNRAADLEHIIEQLFLYSKLDIDEFPFTMRTVEITPVIRDMIEEVSDNYAARGLEIHLAENFPEIKVNADTLHFRNVIMNILENSVKYKTKDNGRIDISASRVNGTIMLRFYDDGPGVPPDDLKKIFDAHYRTDPSRSKKGSGLGLAICGKIIERMGGSYYAELPADGGLAIVICLPVNQGE